MDGKNTDYPWRTKSPLQGFVKCPTCHHIQGCRQTKRTLKDGTVRTYRSFSCRICKCNNEPIQTSNANVLEEKVFALIREKYGSVETKTKETPDIKQLEKEIEKLETKKINDFEKYKLGKITRAKFLEIKNDIDTKIENLNAEIEETQKTKDSVKEDIITRELMEKYVLEVFCEGNEVLNIEWK